MLPPDIRQSAHSYAIAHKDDNLDEELKLVEAYMTGATDMCERLPVEESPLPISSRCSHSPIVSASCACGTDEPSFDDFWKLYDYKKAKPQALKFWKRLSLQQRREVMAAIPAYIASTPDKAYRLHPATFLNPANERWRDEITIKQQRKDATQQRLSAYAETIASIK